MAATTAMTAFNSYSPQEQAQESTDTPQLSKKPKTLLHKHPLYTPTHSKLSLQFKEKILCLEVMGIDSGKALSLNPSIHSTSLDSIHSIITFLRSKGIQQKDLPRIIDHNFRRVINKCPRLLVSSVENQLKPALFYLQRLGFRDLEALAYQDCVLLVSNVENTLIPKLDYLIGLGFSKREAIEMVLRCPGLFTFSLENNFKPKFEYFEKEMMRDLSELKDFPQYFAFSLEKRIKPRHLEALECGIKIPLPLLLKTTDEEFADLLKQGDNNKSRYL
ncbi:unnamed protein product [Lactuca saligna]|uniref:Uncharacterized protein n=1 Tax=Lactuca saligna TaxID=75948 RepID=A0AA36EGT0_LACSI|nr:unnamed protein product [Lactuca saligna]